MRVLNKYIIHDFLVMFFMTLLIFTFVMCLGVVLKAIDLAARGISAGFIFRVFSYNVPYMLTFSIPMSVLTTVLLHFGRLSFDGELTAMKASGISLWQVIAPVLLISMVLSLVCVLINTTVAPRCRHAVRSLLVDVGSEEPINLLEAGRFVRDFPGLMIYIGARKGAEVKDIIVYELGNNGPVRNVRAKSGKLRMDKEERAMFIDLYDVRIDQSEKEKGSDMEKTHYINAQHYPVKLDFSKMQKKGSRKKVADMTFSDLMGAIRNAREEYPDLKYEDLLRQRMNMVVESNKRLALSSTCFAFTLLGIPLGMRSKRKESSIGIGISLGLVFFFYLFIIAANALVDHPELRPDMIVWIPVVAAEVFGFFLIRRVS